jgi:endoribonuclease Dicer
MVPTASENQLHASRAQIIGNRTLKNCAERTGLPAYIHTKPFAQKTWLPHNFSSLPNPAKSNDSSEDTPQHLDSLGADLARLRGSAVNTPVDAPIAKGSHRHLEDKVQASMLTVSSSDRFQVIADVAEAILGAAYLSGGDATAQMALKALKLPLPYLERWVDMKARLYIASKTSNIAGLRPEHLKAVEDIVGCTVKHPHLLANALVCHVSFACAPP